MGQLVLGVAGAAIGGLFSPFGASLGFAIGDCVGDVLFVKTDDERAAVEDHGSEAATVAGS